VIRAPGSCEDFVPSSAVVAGARWIRHSQHVPGRTSKLVLAAGFVLVFALAVGLAQLTRGASPAMTSQPASHPAAPTPADVVVEHPAPSATQSAAREHPPSFAAARAPVAAPSKQPELPLTLPSFRREFKRDANGKLVPMITIHELRAQLPLADAPMKACVEKSGQGATGKATLNFTIGAKNNKLVLETTGVQDEETLAGNPELLECMHRTANVLLPEGRAVPELGTGIYVRRHVKVENGVLVEDTLFDFSYNP
jgi:hypothetical protein